MKKRLLIFILLFASPLLAATLTIEIPANDVPRVQEAFGSILGLPGPANQNQVEYAIKQWVIGQTKDYERRKNMAQYTPPPMEMQPSPTPTPAGLAAPAGARVNEPSPTPKPTPTPKKGWW